MKTDNHRPSHDEYVLLVETEFGFLEADFGFSKAWDPRDEYRITYSNGHLSVRVWGWGWGESGHISLNLGDEELPYPKLVTPFGERLTKTTGKKQLDDLREHAYRLKHECEDILRGDLSRMVPHRPFPNAEELWTKRDYSTLIELLEGCDQPLNPEWQNRYEHALRNS